MSRTSQIIGMSEELKDALGIYSASNNMSIADVARQAIAAFIGYDLDAEVNTSLGRRGRPRVYESKEARREASKTRNKEKRALAKQLLEEHRKQERAEELAKMEVSIRVAERKRKAANKTV